MFIFHKLLKNLNFMTMRYCSCSAGRNTIYGLSSGHGKCGVAVIRVSGPTTFLALKSIAGFENVPKPRHAYLRNLKNVNSGEIIDKGLVLWFPGPKSFTGEDSCEFQVHGGLAVINGILNSLSRLPSFRIGEPGEFTKRAFSNGKLDLTEVEGLADLLNAETEIQRKQAFLQTQGSLSKLYHNWKDKISRNLAHLEAQIDFEESENLTEIEQKEVFNNISLLKDEIEKHLLEGQKGEILRQGVKTIILGKPNVGKSSLFNLLCGRQAAIVTPISGTTRDLLEVRLDIHGYPLILIDTAGLRKNTKDPIEQEGIKRAIEQLDDADLIIVMMDILDFSKWKSENPNLHNENYLKNYIKLLGLEENEILNKSRKVLYVMNKTDLKCVETEGVLSISCKNNQGMDKFLTSISNLLKEICGEPSKEHPTMNKTRHREHLEDCLKELHMINAMNNIENQNIDVVIIAEHLRRASKHIGKLVGTVTTDQLLDIIFRDFCIGK